MSNSIPRTSSPSTSSSSGMTRPSDLSRDHRGSWELIPNHTVVGRMALFETSPFLWTAVCFQIGTCLCCWAGGGEGGLFWTLSVASPCEEEKEDMAKRASSRPWKFSLALSLFNPRYRTQGWRASGEDDPVWVLRQWEIQCELWIFMALTLGVLDHGIITGGQELRSSFNNACPECRQRPACNRP